MPDATPARRLRDALEPIALHCLAAPPVWAALGDVGLGPIEGYVWGRASALGEPSPGVVVAAFGVFAPGFVTEAYESARARVARPEVLAARERGAVAALGEVVSDDTELAPIADAVLDAVVDLDSTGRPLFSGLRDLPVPPDALGRAWRAAELVREHRGDGHLAACIGAGLDAVEMNVLTELWLGYKLGEYSRTRGHAPEAIDTAMAGFRARGWADDERLTVSGIEVRDRIEAATDRSQTALIAALGDRLDMVIDAAAAVGEAIVAAGGMAADPRKRAAG